MPCSSSFPSPGGIPAHAQQELPMATSNSKTFTFVASPFSMNELAAKMNETEPTLHGMKLQVRHVMPGAQFQVPIEGKGEKGFYVVPTAAGAHPTMVCVGGVVRDNINAQHMGTFAFGDLPGAVLVFVGNHDGPRRTILVVGGTLQMLAELGATASNAAAAEFSETEQVLLTELFMRGLREQVMHREMCSGIHCHCPAPIRMLERVKKMLAGSFIDHGFLIANKASEEVRSAIAHAVNTTDEAVRMKSFRDAKATFDKAAAEQEAAEQQKVREATERAEREEAKKKAAEKAEGDKEVTAWFAAASELVKKDPPLLLCCLANTFKFAREGKEGFTWAKWQLEMVEMPPFPAKTAEEFAVRRVLAEKLAGDAFSKLPPVVQHEAKGRKKLAIDGLLKGQKITEFLVAPTVVAPKATKPGKPKPNAAKANVANTTAKDKVAKPNQANASEPSTVQPLSIVPTSEGSEQALSGKRAMVLLSIPAEFLPFILSLKGVELVEDNSATSITDDLDKTA